VFNECRWRGIAAIGYAPMEGTDLGQYPHGQPADLWSKLTPTQKSSLGHVAYDMRKGHLIFVKEGSRIVCKGTVRGPYQFNRRSGLLDGGWPHEVPVEWDESFRPVKTAISEAQIGP